MMMMVTAPSSSSRSLTHMFRGILFGNTAVGSWNTVQSDPAAVVPSLQKQQSSPMAPHPLGPLPPGPLPPGGLTLPLPQLPPQGSAWQPGNDPSGRQWFATEFVPVRCRLQPRLHDSHVVPRAMAIAVQSGPLTGTPHRHESEHVTGGGGGTQLVAAVQSPYAHANVVHMPLVVHFVVEPAKLGPLTSVT